MCAQNTSRGQKLSWREREQGKCRSWKLAKGELDWKVVTSIGDATS